MTWVDMRMSSNLNNNSSTENGNGVTASDQAGGGGTTTSHGATFLTGHQTPIFYDGAHDDDADERQARAILLLINQETEKKMSKEEGKNGADRSTAELIQQRVYSQKFWPLMKVSLQRYLQRRKLRAQARMAS